MSTNEQQEVRVTERPAKRNQLRQTLVGNELMSTVDLRNSEGLGAGAMVFVGVVDRLAGVSERYETMVFPCDDDGHVTSWSERDCARCSTREEAFSNHERIVAERLKLAQTHPRPGGQP